MNKTWILTKIMLKNGNGLWAKGNKNRKKTRIPFHLLLPVILVIAFLPLAFSFSYMISGLYDALAEIQQEGVILGLGLSAVSLAIFVFGIFYVINVFYFSQDIEHLLPLPVKPSQILAAKFAVVMLFEYVTQLILLLPVVITFGIKSGSGIIYYVYSLLLFLALPLIPLIIGSIIAMIVMRFTNVAKNKDRFRMFGGIAAVVIGLGSNLLFQRFAGNEMDPEQLQDMVLGGNNSFLGLSANLFPSAKFGAAALLHEGTMLGFVNLLIFLAISALFYIAFVFLGEKLYFGGVMGISESSAQRKQLTQRQLNDLTLQSSTIKAYFMKEWRVLFRTPSFFMNCVLISFLWPVILCIPLLTQPEMVKNIQVANEYVVRGDVAGIVIALAFAGFLFISGSNPTACTAISREGQTMFVNKYLPIPYSQMLIAKVLSGFVLSGISVILLAVVAGLVVKLPIMLVAAVAVVGMLAALFSCLTGIIIDLNMPKLQWDNEQKAVKQNMNSLYNLILNVITAGIIAALAFILKLDGVVAFLSILLLFSAINIGLYKLVIRKGNVWINKMDV